MEEEFVGMTVNEEKVFSTIEKIIMIQSLWKCIKMCKVSFLIILILEVNVLKKILNLLTYLEYI